MYAFSDGKNTFCCTVAIAITKVTMNEIFEMIYRGIIDFVLIDSTKPSLSPLIMFDLLVALPFSEFAKPQVELLYVFIFLKNV